MNYLALKSMMESIIKNFKCPFCNREVGEWNVDIVWAAWSTANLDIICPECWKHSMIKIDMISLDIWTINIDKNNLSKLKNWISWMTNQEIEDSIKDEQIIDLNRNLRKDWLNVSDLLKEKGEK